MVSLTPQLRCALVTEAERARIAADARCAAVSRWDREDGVLRTLVNVGWLDGRYERFPEDETYPLESFPAVDALLRRGIPYLNPEDISSVSLAATWRHGSHAGVPIVVEGSVWGELWAARPIDAGLLTEVDVQRLQLVAGRLGDALGPYA